MHRQDCYLILLYTVQ
uniref:Uncharacterized protein n=1 Tax=Anguilla anguilla TaxID=7936 RepID=A0A0E9XPP0_ANGAN